VNDEAHLLDHYTHEYSNHVGTFRSHVWDCWVSLRGQVTTVWEGDTLYSHLTVKFHLLHIILCLSVAGL